MGDSGNPESGMLCGVTVGVGCLCGAILGLEESPRNSRVSSRNPQNKVFDSSCWEEMPDVAVITGQTSELSQRLNTA